MVEPRVLVVFFSRTGATRKVAEAISAAGGWDIEEMVDTESRLGLVGYLRSGFEAAFGRLTRLRESVHDPSAYDLVVIGGPVWNASMSSPVRAYLARHRPALGKVAFFLTLGGSGRHHALAQMQRASGHRPLGVLAVTESEVARGAHAGRARAFAAVLRAALPAELHVRRASAPPQQEARK